jgi:hypothetical protein
MNMIQTAMDWIQRNVGERVSKQELVQKAQGSDLPGEIKGAIGDLPEGEHTKQDVMSMLRDKVTGAFGGGGGGFGDLGGMLGG